jgi:hypothetical protein
MIVGVTTPHTPLVVPRAHDCMTFFLGSKERYQKTVAARTDTYYYTAGWLECRQRRKAGSMQKGVMIEKQANYDDWSRRYGEEESRYLQDVMEQWAKTFKHGMLVDFDFSKNLNLAAEVQKICADRGWTFEEVEGDIGLLQRWLDGGWSAEEFQVVRPGEKLIATCDDRIVGAQTLAKLSPCGGRSAPARGESRSTTK